MIYTDNIHLIADSLKELHIFAESIGLKRCYFHGMRKGHPHYDLMNVDIRKKAIDAGANLVSSRFIVNKCNEIYNRGYDIREIKSSKKTR